MTDISIFNYMFKHILPHIMRVICRTGKGAATKFCLGGRIHRLEHPNQPTPKLIFSSDFGYFIWKMLDHAKLYTCQKKLLKYHSFWGDVTH